VSDDDVKPDIVVDVDSDHGWCVEPGDVGEVHSRIERSVAITSQQRHRGLLICERDHNVQLALQS
jgi:hypothetical protein